MPNIIKSTLKFKRGKSTDWEKNNFILAEAEPGFEIDTGKLKIGDGKTEWNNLPYINEDIVSLSPDGKSLAVNLNGILSIYGYQDATTGQIPIKIDDKLQWINLSEVAKSGNIKDLIQTEKIELFGGSATENI